MHRLYLNYDNTKELITQEQLVQIKPEIDRAKHDLDLHTGTGNDFHGWTELPHRKNGNLTRLKQIAAEVRDKAQNFISIGIGGSYLGAQAAISAMHGEFSNQKNNLPRLFFAGQNMSSLYLNDLIKVVDFKHTYLNVISKSGTTTEPGLAFRVLYAQLVAAVGETEANKRVIATTDASNGALRNLSDLKRFRTFIIPDDVGGRFSVLTPVGLFPIAAAGIDIDELIGGAHDMALLTRSADYSENPALLYAAIRNLLFRSGKVIEILANFEPRLHFVNEWWKQLFGESEGKNNKGIFPASVDLSTDLHSMGQFIQDGMRNIFETFLTIEKDSCPVILPETADDYDGFNYLAGKTLAYVNQKAYEGTAMAHTAGGCPNMTISFPKLSPYWIGQLFYFFEYAVAISGYVLGVNPFDQPGVEAYKTNMFKLLGKAGF